MTIMTCARCQELEAEVVYLRGVIAVGESEEAQACIRLALDVSPIQARILLKLYAASGRLVQGWALREFLKEDGEPNLLRVHLHFLRRRLPPASIETVKGIGYRLSKAASAQIAESLAA